MGKKDEVRLVVRSEEGGMRVLNQGCVWFSLLAGVVLGCPREEMRIETVRNRSERKRGVRTYSHKQSGRRQARKGTSQTRS